MLGSSIKETAENNILACSIVLGNEKCKNISRYGVLYECEFEKESIIISYSEGLKIMKTLDVKLDYSIIEYIRFSLSKQMSTWGLAPNSSFSADIIIKIKNSTNIYQLETSAFTLLEGLRDFLYNKGVSVIDDIGLIEILSNKSHEEKYDYLNKNFNELAEKFNLDNPRLSAEKSKSKEFTKKVILSSR